ncbi:exocyst complex component 8 [Galendromus occidentalis]|uniref:Exocyst complex component 8 n=1 Tax=Galendromus occidentalis TaxID=34638 RepID=A0AAJ6QPK4_9ACAR|nr:exocyst complex component 8 [Galendromus occidentalis]
MPLETEMESATAQKFSQLSFDPEKYVSSIVQRAGTVEKILQEKQDVLNLQEQTSYQLKKNVYDNYKQFIDTAREISYVASEMHQLREMLHKQEQLLHGMTGLSIVQHKNSNKLLELPEELECDPGIDTLDGCYGEDDLLKRKENISFLLERVEGCARLLDGSEKNVLKTGEATLVERDEISKIQLCLLTDSLLIADCLPVKRGTIQYRLRWVFELDSLAAVDGNSSSQMKMLVFPQTILLQMESLQEKLVWMEAIRKAKTVKLTRQAVINARINYPSLALALDQTDSVEEDALIPEWLIELPDELDVCIAERNFEQAVELLQKVKEYWPSQEGYSCSTARDVRLRISNRQEQLIKVLCSELSVGVSLHGGPRAAKRAVKLLIELGQTASASRLFLAHRAVLLRTATKNQSQHSEGAVNAFVKRVCGAFFNHVAETGRQYQRAFISHSPAIASALVSWCCAQLDWFVHLLSRQLFSAQTSLATVAEAVQTCIASCGQLQDIGLDLGFVILRNLRKELGRSISDGRDKLLEAIRHRSTEDTWKPQKVESKWLQSLERHGLDLSAYIYDENMTYLTSNTVAFTKSLLHFVSDLMALYTPPLHRLMVDSVCEAVRAHRRHIAAAFSATKLKSDQKFIQRNESFLLNNVAKAIEKRCSSSPQGVLLWPEIQSAFEGNAHGF